jgi:hypothetical protein
LEVDRENGTTFWAATSKVFTVDYGMNCLVKSGILSALNPEALFLFTSYELLRFLVSFLTIVASWKSVKTMGWWPPCLIEKNLYYGTSLALKAETVRLY